MMQPRSQKEPSPFNEAFALSDLRSILEWRGPNGKGHGKIILSRETAEWLFKMASIAARN